MNYFVYIKDILGIKTNVNNFSWVYGRVAPKAKKSDYDKCEIKINFEVRNTDDVFEKSFDIDEYDRYNYFYAKKDDKKIYYDRTFLFSARLRYKVELFDDCINFVVNKNYFRFIKHKFINLHSVEHILNDIAAGKLLFNGYATLHCSAVKIGNRTLVIFGPPSIGKTITAIKLSEEENAQFICEDIALTDGSNIYSVPWTSTFRYYEHDKESIKDKIANNIERKIPFLKLTPSKNKKSINSYLNNALLKERVKATDLIVLGKGNNEFIETKEGIFENIINLNKYQFNYHKSPTMLCINYFNPSISLDKMYDIEKKLVGEVLDNTNAFRIYAENASDYSEIIKDNLLNK